jgi:hypothetical protein
VILNVIHHRQNLFSSEHFPGCGSNACYLVQSYNTWLQAKAGPAFVSVRSLHTERRRFLEVLASQRTLRYILWVLRIELKHKIQATFLMWTSDTRITLQQTRECICILISVSKTLQIYEIPGHKNCNYVQLSKLRMLSILLSFIITQISETGFCTRKGTF